MEIDVGPLTKSQAEEAMSVCFMWKKIVKNPRLKLKNRYTGDIIFVIIYCLIVTTMIIYGILVDSMIMILLCGFALGLLCLVFGSIRSSYKSRDNLMGPTHNVKYILDNEGFESNSEIKRLIIKWDKMKFIRIEKNGIYIIPKEASGVVLGFPLEYKDQILAYVKEIGLDFEVYDMTARTK